MADTKISGLDDAGALEDDDELVVARTGDNKKTTVLSLTDDIAARLQVNLFWYTFLT